MLALTFADKSDYDKIREDDLIDIIGLTTFSANTPLTIKLKHSDGSEDQFRVSHSYNENQIEWFKAGSALNLVRKNLE
jgi:aconitate hydratase